jgi:sugar lactone lactonase YvrE
VWELETRAELLRGEARNVSITDTGRLRLAPEFDQVFDAAQAYIWSSAADRGGNLYLGTGHDGKVYRVAPDASGAMRGAVVFDSEELDVFALAVATDGTLYAATSPDGRVYRIGASGKADSFLRPAGEIHLVACRDARRRARGRHGRRRENLSRSGAGANARRRAAG